jgi:hypothetical protein
MNNPTGSSILHKRPNDHDNSVVQAVNDQNDHDNSMVYGRTTTTVAWSFVSRTTGTTEFVWSSTERSDDHGSLIVLCSTT